MDPNSGRKYLQVSEYAERISIDQPQIAIAMADEIPIASSSRRKATAVKRTLEWYHQLAMDERVDWKATSLFGVVPGCLESDGIQDVLQQLLASGAKGIVVGGVFQGEADEHSNIAIQRIRECLDAAMASDAKIPLMVQNVRTPSQVTIHSSIHESWSIYQSCLL